MKKYLILGLIFISAMSFFFFKKSGDKVDADPTIKNQSSKELFLGSRKRINPSLEPKITDVIDSCDEIQSILDEIDFSQSRKEWLENVTLEQFKKCTNPQVQDRIGSIENTCYGKAKSKECEMNLVFLRSQLRARSIKDPSDKEELADLIMNEFAKSDNPNFKLLEKLTSKLMDMNPSNAIQKFWALSKLLSQKDFKNVPQDAIDEIYRRIRPELWNGPDLLPLDMALKTGFDAVRIEDYVRESIQNFPGNSSMQEILGWSLWKQNRREEAFLALDRAIELNPKDQYLRDMRGRLRDPKANVDSYQARIMLGLNFNDLFL